MAAFPSLLTDPAYLRNRQYADSSNLDARVALHLHFSTNPYGWMRWVFDGLLAAMPAATASILEFGCGPAHLWRENADRIPAGWLVTLTDLSAGMVEQARAALAPAGRAFSLRVADIQDAPFDSGSFDLVIANHMLYHVPDRQRAIAEARRLLRPGGMFFAATNGADHMRELAELCLAFDPSLDLWRAGAVRGFSLENGAEQLQRSFAHVVLDVYDDGLILTEIDPVVAYVDSMAHMDADLRQRFGRFVGAALDANHGVFHVTKSSGLFRAW